MTEKGAEFVGEHHSGGKSAPTEHSGWVLWDKHPPKCPFISTAAALAVGTEPLADCKQIT